MYTEIYVCCPGNLVTGGTELLHQLVDKLRKCNLSAYISYYPFNKNFCCPNAFKIYDTSNKTPVDQECSLLIIPEALTRIAKHYSLLKIAVWWLSVDFYFFKLHENLFLDWVRNFRSYTKGRIPLKNMHRYIHFHQSEYARIFLAKHAISSTFLSDYLNHTHLKSYDKNKTRLNVILYNPKKGIKITKHLISIFKNLTFIPLENMSNIEIRQHLENAKIYIDFGFHPGKDRFPREAVMAGCCVITGLKGAAHNPIDIPINNQYKINEESRKFLYNFEKIVTDIFNNFDHHSEQFNNYRNIIKIEKKLFEQQVEKIFCSNSII